MKTSYVRALCALDKDIKDALELNKLEREAAWADYSAKGGDSMGFGETYAESLPRRYEYADACRRADASAVEAIREARERFAAKVAA